VKSEEFATAKTSKTTKKTLAVAFFLLFTFLFSLFLLSLHPRNQNINIIMDDYPAETCKK